MNCSSVSGSRYSGTVICPEFRVVGPETHIGKLTPSAGLMEIEFRSPLGNNFLEI